MRVEREVEAAGELSLAKLIAGWAVRTPSALALLAPSRPPLNYRDLWDLLRRTAEMLCASGIGQGDSVALLMPSGPEAATAFLAIASVAACVPLNPAQRSCELEICLADLQPKAVITRTDLSAELRRVIAALGRPVLEIVVDPGAVAGSFRLVSARPAVAQPSFAAREAVALILPTSGTTARPKLVPLTHANLTASARVMAESLRLSQADRCLNVMPLFHIHGLVGALLSSISAGGSLICPGAFRGADFFEHVEVFTPTWYTAVPTLHQAVLAQARRRASHTASFRFIRSCSAALPPTVAAELEQRFGAPVVEAYGMTEASHQVACNPLPPGQRKPGSVGLPTGTEIVVAHTDGLPAARGEIGEVLIRGAGLTAGYLGDAPDGKAFAEGWFHTGDLGRLDEDGYLFLEGRSKEVINRAGEKIAPRQIEEAVLEHPAVGEAAAFALPDPRLGEAVGLAVALREGAAAAENELREFVSARVSAAKVPQRIVVVAAIPKGPTGKPRRIGLARELGLHDPAPPPRRADPAIESALAALWRQVLRIDRVRPEDNFFELGGDSLSAAELVLRIEQLTGARLSLAALFNAPTLASLAALVPCNDARLREPRLAVVQSGGAERPFFCVGAGPMYRALASQLGAERPFLSLYCPDARALPQPYRIEDLAAFHIETMREVQPHGPYLLGGWCASGIIAYEMAKQLRDRGERVDVLVLFDAANPAAAMPQPGSETPLPRPSPKTRRMVSITAQLRWAARRLRRIAVETSCPLLVWLGRPVPLRDADLARDLALRRYVPRPYGGPVMLFRRAHRLMGRYLDERLGWGAVICGPIEAHTVPGGHQDMFVEPQVAIVGAAIKARIEGVKSVEL